MIFLAFATPDSRTELWRVSGEAVTKFHKKNKKQMSASKKSAWICGAKLQPTPKHQRRGASDART
jgi:hypothetical protein